jgi:hypothetical protein
MRRDVSGTDLLVVDGDLETDVPALRRPRSVRGLPVSL